MRTLSLFLILLVGASLGFAPAPVPKENPRDPAVVLRQLQGNWRMTRYERAGANLTAANESYLVKIDKDQWTFFRVTNGGPVMKTSSFTITLDPKATPAAIDFTDKGRSSLSGSFLLSQDKLTIVFRSGGPARAKNLTAPGPKDYFLYLERQP